MIADPELPYAELADRLRALDWQWRGEAQSLPTIPGEPEHVVWGHEDPDALLVYTFNPAVAFRVLALSGPGAEVHRARLASAVPHLADDAVAALIGSADVASCVRGLFAARELGLAMALPLVYARVDDADDLIAQLAAEVAQELPEAVATRARERLEATRAPDGEASPASLLALLGEPALRRQVLRHAAATLTAEQRPALRFLLELGLADADWEVRATAMVLCGRVELTAARDAVAALALPADDRFGHSPRDLDRLALLRRVVLARLDGAHPPDDGAARHAWQCVVDGQDGVFDAVFLLVHALTAPLALETSDAAPLPAGVEVTAAGFRLARSRLPVVRVAPVPCWLGDPDTANPLRRVVPQRAVFVAARPLSRALARWIRAGAHGPAPDAGEGDDDAVPLADALELCGALAALEGAAVELPGADQWEMAARGPDGRRYPWGNGLEPGPEHRASPWGLVGMTGGPAQWVRPSGARALACGGPSLACSERRACDPSERLAVRPVVR